MLCEDARQRFKHSAVTVHTVQHDDATVVGGARLNDDWWEMYAFAGVDGGGHRGGAAD